MEGSGERAWRQSRRKGLPGGWGPTPAASVPVDCRLWRARYVHVLEMPLSGAQACWPAFATLVVTLLHSVHSTLLTWTTPRFPISLRSSIPSSSLC